MKKLFGIIVPLIILVSVLGLLVFAYSNGRKGLGCDSDKEPAVSAGKQYVQQLIDQIERYKTIHGKYPENYQDLGESILDNGKGYPNPNITGLSGDIKPDLNYFRITFTFKNDYVCPLGQARKCTYRSENEEWFCD